MNFSFLTEWTPQKPVFLLISPNDDFANSNCFIAKLFFYNWFNQKKFPALAKKLITVEVVAPRPYKQEYKSVNWTAMLVEGLKYYRDLLF